MSRFALVTALVVVLGLLSPWPDLPPARAQAPAKKANAKPPAATDDDLSRVTLAFDPGSHSRPISALGFTKDQSKLVTVGMDYTIQIWSTATGERLDILRLAPYGRDNGIDTTPWDAAAVSPDGNFVAIGGSVKHFWSEQQITRLVLVDIERRLVRKISLRNNTSTITSFAFSATGKRLIVGTNSPQRAIHIADDYERITRSDPGADNYLRVMPGTDLTGGVSKVALSPSGERLVVSDAKHVVSIWDVAGKNPARWKKLASFADAGRTDAMAWSPDGSYVARSWASGTGGENRGIELRDLAGKQIKNWSFKEMTPGFGSQTQATTLDYVAANRMVIAAHGNISPGSGYGAILATLDPTTGKTVRLFSDASTASQGTYKPYGAASATGDLAATSYALGLEALICRASDGQVVARCSSRARYPTAVAWSNDPKTPVVAWAENPEFPVRPAKVSDLQFAFDLSKMEAVRPDGNRDFSFRRTTIGDWTLTTQRGAGVINFNNNPMLAKKGEAAKRIIDQVGIQATTLVANGAEPPRMAYSHGELGVQHRSRVFLVDADGKQLAQWPTMATMIRTMASSPDGRYFAVTTGTHRVSIYRADKPQPFPFLNVVRIHGEWVAWTPEGYYAASPGGERLIGWAVSNGVNDFVTYYPAERFAKVFRRPDLIRKAFELGSVADALVALEVQPVEIETILPPKATLEFLERTATGAVRVKAAAVSGAKDKPVLSMRVMLDGRPLPGGKGNWTFTPGQPAEAVLELDVPPDVHELKLLARSADGDAISDPLPVQGPKKSGTQATIHRVCVGVNEYDDPGLKLGSSAKDAEAIFHAFARDCVGPYNRFGAAKGELILNKDATRARVLTALKKVRDEAVGGDLVVVFFAGHGIMQNESFYLLTKEADLTKDLKGISVSGEELQAVLKDVECPVLLIMDACQSSGALKSFRPAAPGLTRGLANNQTGVTVLSAAAELEEAEATAEGGHFTQGILKALKLAEGVPFEPYKRKLYVDHIYLVVASEVQRATGERQNPTFKRPETSPFVAVRDVPVR